MREMSLPNVTRLWDTYLAEGPDAFSDFHLYVCSVFLCKWSKELQGMDFQVSSGGVERERERFQTDDCCSLLRFTGMYYVPSISAYGRMVR